MSLMANLTAAPHFWRQPVRYMRWASHEKPAIFFSILIGAAGPLMLIGAPPIQRYFGWQKRIEIPATYPGEWLSFLGCRD